MRTNSYCSDDPSGFICNRPAVGPWEEFRLEYVSGDKIALRSTRTNWQYCSDQEKFRYEDKLASATYGI
jgi:hypothetical protein